MDLTVAILLMQEQAQYSQVKKALAPFDQRALEQLFIYANLHVAEVADTTVSKTRSVGTR